MTRLTPSGWWLATALGLFACAPPESSTVAMGRELYTGNGCVSCHGLNGHGDGPIGKTLSPPPRDFRNAAAFKNGTDVSAIAETILRGVGDATQMPAFGHLSARERQSLALYVISVRDSTPSTNRIP
ncbi:MAG: cytochrome c [Gemmatimonadaceae bacterium]|nr:cytochrome c [Gemmatimonadaceae bacterium]